MQGERVRYAIGLLVTAGLPFLALVSACSDERTSAPQQQGTSAPQPPVVQGRGDDNTTQVGVSATTGCEELGALNGTSLRAFLGDQIQSVTFPLANRPVPSRLAVVAVGNSEDLVGKTVALGAAENANYQSCTQCLVIALGCSATDCKQAAWFFPRSGTATLTAAASQSGQAFDGRFDDVVLEQVKIDPTTTESKPVAGGPCLHIQELTFASSASAAGTKTDAGSTTSSSSSSGGPDAGDGGGGSSGTGTSSGLGGGGGGGGMKGDPDDLFAASSGS